MGHGAAIEECNTDGEQKANRMPCKRPRGSNVSSCSHITFAANVRLKLPPHNLKHLLYKIRFFILHTSLLSRCIVLQNQLHKKRRVAPVLAHGRSLTTNHLPCIPL